MAMGKRDARGVPPKTTDLSECLRGFLASLGWDYNKLAAATGISHKTVHNYVNGTRTNLSPEHLDKLGAAIRRGLMDSGLPDEAAAAKAALWEAATGHVPEELDDGMFVEADEQMIIVGYRRLTPKEKVLIRRALEADENEG